MIAHFTYEVADDVPQRFADHVGEQLGDGGLLLLSGGHTILELLAPLRSYLATIKTSRTAIGQVDERLVPCDDDRSNWHHISRGLDGVDHIALPMIHCHTPTEKRLLADCEDPDPGVQDARMALAHGYAKRYEILLNEYQPWSVAHLGLGPDGHTASLFPESDALGNRSDLVTSNVDPSHRNPIDRITLTFGALNRFKYRIIVATGADKAAVVERALYGEGLPIHALDADNTLLLLDSEAARGLTPETTTSLTSPRSD